MRIIHAAIVFAILLAGSVSAQAFELISRDEITAIRDGSLPGAKLEAAPRSAVANAPVIELLEPGSANRFRAPVNIHLRLSPGAGSAIDMSSLEIRYMGSIFSFDITDRILEHAQVTNGEIVANNADLPAGEHEILIRVNDSLRRTGERRFAFEVLED